ncbi:MAG: hypothetical protein ACKESB_00575 [Candidatus Hodgkinia cicadicola]
MGEGKGGKRERAGGVIRCVSYNCRMKPDIFQPLHALSASQ